MLKSMQRCSSKGPESGSTAAHGSPQELCVALAPGDLIPSSGFFEQAHIQMHTSKQKLKKQNPPTTAYWLKIIHQEQELLN